MDVAGQRPGYFLKENTPLNLLSCEMAKLFQNS